MCVVNRDSSGVEDLDPVRRLSHEAKSELVLLSNLVDKLSESLDKNRYVLSGGGEA